MRFLIGANQLFSHPNQIPELTGYLFEKCSFTISIQKFTQAIKMAIEQTRLKIVQ
jgi:hypothetical protein